MYNFARLNINEKGNPVLREAPTQQQIKDFESNFHIKLPDLYINMLHFSNGGHPELNMFIPVGETIDNRWSINTFYYLNSDKNDYYNLWNVTNIWQSFLGSMIIPFAADSGDNQIVFNFEIPTSPKVQICIHDQNYQLIDVASSFYEFIELLSEDPDMM